MGKRLMVIRHAKSCWKNSSLKDFYRPLNTRGNNDAPMMAQRLAAKNYLPQLIVTSPAVRAFTTALYFAKTWKMPEKSIMLEDDMYEADASALLKIIYALPDEYDSIALFGHNPGLQQLVNKLAQTNIEMPTAAVAAISFTVNNWAQIQFATGNISWYDYPKNLANNL